MNKLWIIAVAGLMATGAAYAQGDATEGETVFKKCAGCHAVGENARNKVGPVLNDMFGRTAGTFEGYNYSPAMVEAGQGGLVWTEESFATFIAAPRDVVQGTKMSFPGLKDEADIANLTAYLLTHSPNYTPPAQ